MPQAVLRPLFRTYALVRGTRPLFGLAVRASPRARLPFRPSFLLAAPLAIGIALVLGPGLARLLDRPADAPSEGSAEIVVWDMPAAVCVSGQALTVTRISGSSLAPEVTGRTFCLQETLAPGERREGANGAFECPAGLVPFTHVSSLLVMGESQDVDEVKCLSAPQLYPDGGRIEAER